MSEMIERVRRAIREAEIDYSIRLTRLVDGVSTYTLSRPGHEPMEFPSHEEALEYVSELRDAERARAAIEAMREPTEEMIAAGARGSGEDSPDVALGAWEAMIDAALSKDSDHAKGEGE